MLRSTMIAAAVMMLGSGAAGAMPVAPIDAGATAVVQVMQGCGYGEHRGAYGGCRLNHNRSGLIRRAMTGAPGGCRPGFRRMQGRCMRSY